MNMLRSCRGSADGRGEIGLAQSQERVQEGSHERVPLRRLIAYAQMVVPLAVIGLPIAIYIPPFYSGTLGLDLAAVGLVLMLARFSDVITDPLIGRLSDRTRSRFGRRRPWILAGVPLMVMSAYMLFVPSEPVSLIYLLLWISLIYLGFTLIGIPFGAWGAELSLDYHERSRVTGAREIFLLLGLLLAITAPIVGVSLLGGESEADKLNSASREAMSVLGWLTVGLLPLCAFILFACVPEPKERGEQTISMREGIKAISRNGPFRRILFSSMLGALAGSLNAAVAILFFDHVLKLGEAGFVLILVLFGAAVAGAPLWVSLGKNLGKHRALCVAAMFSLGAFAAVPFVVYMLVPTGNTNGVFVAMFIITAVQGLAAGATPILGASMLADVVDLDTMRTGEHRTGLLFAFLGMVRKIFEAAGVGIALPFIAFWGFDPQSGTQTDLGVLSIILMYCLLPLALWLGSLAIIWNFPLTAERHARIRAAYDRRLLRANVRRQQPAD
ncbi:MAG: MFS transporter [Rhodobiaceae bacterium]|nr:MFS transporter [Rhodobiaceae bacterium]